MLSKIDQLYNSQRMKSSKLVTYLTQIGRYEQRIQICREILAHNMNFSPAWLVALMKQKEGKLQNKQQKQGENNNITISQFRLFFALIGLVCEDNELIYVFQYFDNRNTGLVKNQHFLQGLLPTLKEGLRKAVLKRTELDVELTLELKHALRRIFTQIMKAKSQLRLYEGQFSSVKSTQTSLQIKRQNIQKFMQKFNKHITQSELTLTYNFLIQGRTKQISLTQICNIIQQSNKQIEYLAKNPVVLGQKIQNQIINVKVKELEGAREVEKIIRKGQRESQYYARGNKNSAPFFNDTIQNKQINNKANGNLQTPSSHSDKGKNAESKNQSPLFNLNGNFKIQRTNSIMQNIEDKSQADIKRAEKLADELLFSNTNKEETPFKRIQQTQTVNKKVGKGKGMQQTPMIYYSRSTHCPPFLKCVHITSGYLLDFDILLSFKDDDYDFWDF